MRRPAGAKTLDEVKARGELRCGVNTGLAGFAAPDDEGHWRGIDADFCRAVAAAIFGDPANVKFVPLNAKERFTALQSGEVDLLSRNTTWTMSRDTSLGLTFVGVMYYDGQGFMVRKSLGLEKVDAARRRQHLRADRHDERAEPRRLFHARDNMSYRPVVFERLDEALVRLHLRPLRCLHDRHLRASISERTRLPNPDDSVIAARAHLARSRWGRPCARATTSGQGSCAGCTLRCSTRKRTA